VKHGFQQSNSPVPAVQHILLPFAASSRAKSST
jgi:hypothetical protein